jgi:carbonyl reductase 1
LKDPSLREEIGNLENLTEEKVDKFVETYLEDVKCQKLDRWPYRAYSVSKIVLNAYTRVLARSLEDRPDGQRIYVNCATPGYCKTDLTKNSGIYTAEEGATTLVWTALLPPNGPSGQFFSQKKSECY